MMFVFAVLMIKPALGDSPLQEMNAFTKILFILVTGYAGSAAILQLPYTDTPHAAWVFQSLPLKNHGSILTGAVKAIFVKFYLPVHLIVTAAAVIVWGISVLKQVLLGLSGTILLSLVVVFFQGMKLPFTEPREMQSKGSMSVNAIFTMVLLIITGGLIYLTTLLPVWVALLFTGGFIFMSDRLFSLINRRKYLVK